MIDLPDFAEAKNALIAGSDDIINERVLTIVEEKYAGHIAVGNCTEHTGERQIKVGSYITDAQYNRYHKAERFQRVRPDERLYATTESVQPYQSYGDGHIQNKR
mgnify:CR=1 FL=1